MRSEVQQASTVHARKSTGLNKSVARLTDYRRRYLHLISHVSTGSSVLYNAGLRQSADIESRQWSLDC